MRISKGALRPKSEAPRKTWQGPRGTTNVFNNSNTADSTAIIRLQRLASNHGIIGARAALFSDLVWGDAA